jgi:uracil-DNA glycosylase
MLKDQISWANVRNKIFSCKDCLRPFPRVAVTNRRLDTYADPNSMARVKLLFVSEAPPGGQNLGSFFHIPQTQDGLRKKLFAALRNTEKLQGIDRLQNEKGLQFFLRSGLYLLPSFNFPCSKMDKQTGLVLSKNANPTFEQLKHSSKHLRDEIAFIRPKMVFALGKSALYTVLQGFGSSTIEAMKLAESVTRASKLEPIVGSKFQIDHGDQCEVWIENWPRIPSMKNHRFKQLVTDLRKVLDLGPT